MEAAGSGLDLLAAGSGELAGKAQVSMTVSEASCAQTVSDSASPDLVSLAAKAFDLVCDAPDQVVSFAASEMPDHRRKPRIPVDVAYEDGAHEGRLETYGFLTHVAGEEPGADVSLPPNDARKVLLHSCCAPCSGAMFEEMVSKDLDVTIFFYNPNIHPREEYEIRKNENKRYALKHTVPFVDCDYDVDAWLERMKGMEFEPERGVRCTECFDMRMEVTALFAHLHGFQCFTTTNATSRWKDVKQVNDSGIRAAARYDDVDFWQYNWQTDAMTRRKYGISAEERFYKQEYCGCSYSLRDSNLWRKKEGIPPIRIGGEEAGLGTRYFDNPELDAEEENQDVVDQFFTDAASQFGNERLRKQFEGRRKSAQTGEGVNNW